MAISWMLLAAGMLLISNQGSQSITLAKSQAAPIDTKDKNVRTYRTTYVPDADDNEFKQFSDKYDPRTRTRKVTNRKKVLRKVKKLKTNKTINPKQARKVNWMYDKPINITKDQYQIEVDTEK